MNRLHTGLLLFLVAAALVITGLFVAAGSTLTRISIELDLQNLPLKQRRVVEAFEKSMDFPISGRVCRGQADKASAMCSLLLPRSFKDYGEHDNLWVFLDGVLVLFSEPLSNNDRNDINKHVVNLVAALAMNETDFYVRTTRSDASNLVATDLYMAIVAQMAICEELSEYVSCTGGAPTEVSQAIDALASFMKENGAKLAPYEMSGRMTAIEAVVNANIKAGPER